MIIVPCRTVEDAGEFDSNATMCGVIAALLELKTKFPDFPIPYTSVLVTLIEQNRPIDILETMDDLNLISIPRFKGVDVVTVTEKGESFLKANGGKYSLSTKKGLN